MSDELDYTPDLYTLVDEEGKEQTFEMLDCMELDDQKYYALIPYHENPEEVLDDDGQLVVLKLEVVDGEEMLTTIDDDDEFNKVGELFLKRIEKIFDDDEQCGCEGCNCGEDCNCDNSDSEK